MDEMMMKTLNIERYSKGELKLFGTFSTGMGSASNLEFKRC